MVLIYCWDILKGISFKNSYLWYCLSYKLSELDYLQSNEINVFFLLLLSVSWIKDLFYWFTYKQHESIIYIMYIVYLYIYISVTYIMII